MERYIIIVILCQQVIVEGNKIKDTDKKNTIENNDDKEHYTCQ